MDKRIESSTLIALISLLFAASALGADNGSLRKDLTAVIALLGLPCGKVVSATRLKANDHIATCRDGNRYRVFLDARGRVVAKKQ